MVDQNTIQLVHLTIDKTAPCTFS